MNIFSIRIPLSERCFFNKSGVVRKTLTMTWRMRQVCERLDIDGMFK